MFESECWGFPSICFSFDYDEECFLEQVSPEELEKLNWMKHVLGLSHSCHKKQEPSTHTQPPPAGTTKKHLNKEHAWNVWKRPSHINLSLHSNAKFTYVSPKVVLLSILWMNGLRIDCSWQDHGTVKKINGVDCRENHPGLIMTVPRPSGMKFFLFAAPMHTAVLWMLTSLYFIF